MKRKPFDVLTVRISQKLEYACRVLIQLSKHHDGKTITRLETLAQREEVSSNFLVQILNDLRRSNIVDSKRGKSGGYLLSRPPADISLYEVVEVIEPSLLNNSVTEAGQSGNSVKSIWDNASTHFNEQLKQINLSTMSTDETPMFYI